MWKHRILTTEVTFRPPKSQRRRITGREKKIEKKKIQRDGDGLQGFKRKTLTLCGTFLIWIKDSQFNDEVLINQLEDAHQEIYM